MGGRGGIALNGDARESTLHFKTDSSAETPKKVPNIDYLGMGYDIFRGNPLEVEEGRADPGWQRLVYNLTYLPGEVTPDGQILQPDNTEIRIEDVCKTNFDSTSILGGSSYQSVAGKSVSASAGFSISGFGAKFGASKAYKSVSASINMFSSVYISATAECQHYNARLLDNSPSLHDEFLDALYTLPADYNPYTAVAFHRFFQEFGTHVVTQVSLGGKYGQVSNVTSSAFADYEMSGKEKGWGAGASYAAMISAGVTSMSSSEHAQGSFFSSKCVHQSTYISGGEFPQDNSAATWQKSVAAQPMPVGFELTPIYAVHESRKEALTAALSGYCEHLKQGGMLDSCEKPVDPPQPPPKQACAIKLVEDYNRDGDHFDDGFPFGSQITTHTTITNIGASWQCGKSTGGSTFTLDFVQVANQCMGKDVSGGKPRLVGFNGYNTNKVVNSWRGCGVGGEGGATGVDGQAAGLGGLGGHWDRWGLPREGLVGGGSGGRGDPRAAGQAQGQHGVAGLVGDPEGLGEAGWTWLHGLSVEECAVSDFPSMMVPKRRQDVGEDRRRELQEQALELDEKTFDDAMRNLPWASGARLVALLKDGLGVNVRPIACGEPMKSAAFSPEGDTSCFADEMPGQGW
ncbi:hypothetical protein CYMTET_4379 [Cymbomonas tetramitiformis]|uniref:MACPF domain-containing protein n=1 Tax=Cymbomonas tetramitiformis TaxID=36881 RepID=A0AAE0H1P1_9CHLO|nr:hypothetical protein CYMTET_4379 [Cymbomonas tetramitiformis]